MARDAYGTTPIDSYEAAGLKIKQISTLEELNEFEQQNIIQGTTWAKAHKRKNILSEKFICDLHRHMFGDVWKWAGSFRKSNKNIGVGWHQISTELRKLIDDTKYWTEHKTYSPDEIGARFHHRLVSIHLFPNGNGRHARLMTDLFIDGLGEAAFTWGANNLKEAVRLQYIKALQLADKGNYVALIKFVRS